LIDVNGVQPRHAFAASALRALIAALSRYYRPVHHIRVTGKLVAPTRELIDVNEMVRHMVALLGDTANRNSILISTELGPQLAKTTADRVQLQQVLMNLMLNGIEAMRGGSGALTITSKSEDGHQMVSVSDSGIGLPVDGADRIFQAFFTTKPDGTGIGLPLSRRIIESHDGRLWASANAPRGAVFHFTVPVTVAAAS
jgi:signal transduction histidine kinase